MAIMVTVKFPMQAGKAPEFLDLLRGALAETRAYAGCIAVRTYAEAGGAHVLLVEDWETKAHQEAYLNWRIETGFLDAIAPFVSGGPEVTHYEIRSE